MAPSNLGYSLREAGSHFARNWTTSLGAVITIFLSLFIIGLFIVGSAMITSAIGTIEDQVTINAFISDDASDEDVQAFMEKLQSWDNVRSVEFNDKDDAINDYRSMSSNADATLAALDGENPLPRSYRIEMEDPSQVADMADQIKQDSDFQQIVDGGDVDASVLYGQEEVSRLFEVTSYIRLAAVVMRLVGASNSFIRGPFVTEGVIQAILGALLAIGVLELGRNLLIPRIQTAIPWLSFNIPLEMYLITYAALVVVGIVIGLFGSAIAMRRYLKV